MQSALGFISFELTTTWLNMPLSFPRSLDVYLSERVQNKVKKQLFATALQESCNALYSELVHYGIISPVLFCQHYTSSVVLIHSASSSLPFLCLPASLPPYFPENICLPSLLSLSLFLSLSYCSTTGISLSH